MGSESILRQVALVSYGTKYLRNELGLEAWYRHGIFFGARLQFRELAENAMLADDFTIWLGILGRSGAVRLSLHLFAEFETAKPLAMDSGDYAVVVHYATHYQIWAVGEERAAWIKHPLMSADASQTVLMFPSAAYYGGDVDSYWRVEERQGELTLPKTSWKALASAIAADLAINIPSSHVPAGPFFAGVPEQPSWAKLPLFPSSPFSSLAHWLLATLVHEHAVFANDMNSKNDSSVYQHLDAVSASEMRDRGARLDSWMIEVQIRCANEYRSSEFLDGNSPLVRIHMAGVLAQPGSADPQRMDSALSPVKEKISHTGLFSADVEKPQGKWVGRIVFVIVITAVSFFILACAHLIARFPLLAVLIGLPLALYKKDKGDG